MTIRVKICGITSYEDAEFVCASGVDAIGLVFYEKSPRNVTVQQALDICKAVPPFVTVVGLFVNMYPNELSAILQRVPLDLLQFHGAESPDYCSAFSRPYIKAVPMKGLGDFAAYADQYTDAKGFLVDSHASNSVGGSGKTFNWEKIPKDYPKPIILAGGLNPENIAAAIKMTNIYGVDVSSGVEALPGKKDQSKIKAFMQVIKN